MLFMKLKLKKERETERKLFQKHFSFTMTTLTNFAVKYFLLTSFYTIFLHFFILSLVLLFILPYLTLISVILSDF